MQHVKYSLRRDSNIINVSSDNGITVSSVDENDTDLPYTAAAFGSHSSVSMDNKDLARHSSNAFEAFILGYPDNVYLSYRCLRNQSASSIVQINSNTKAAASTLRHIAQYIEILMLRKFSNTAIIDRLVERLGLDKRHFQVYDINDYKIPKQAPVSLPEHKWDGYVKPRRRVTVGEY